MQLTQIDLLIHPGYFQNSRPFDVHHEVQTELNRAWRSRAAQISQNPGHLLFYFSNFDLRYLEDIDSSETRIMLGSTKIPGLKEDYIRIDELRQMLGDNFIFFENGAFPVKNQLLRLFSDHRWIYSPDEIIITAYGELSSKDAIPRGCVPTWAERICEELEIPSQNLHIPSELTLLREQLGTINEWRNEIRTGFSNTARK